MLNTPTTWSESLGRWARKAALVTAGAVGFSALWWSVAQSQSTNPSPGSYVNMGGQVVGPANSPTLNSTFSLSGNDEVNWITYLQSKMASPFEAIGESTFFENNIASANFKWIKGKLVIPPNTTFEWFVNGQWTSTEPATGTPVLKVRWKLSPMFVVKFGNVSGTVDFSGTGDGFRIIPYGKNLYVINHHTNNMYLNCRVAATGSPCPGFPSNGTGLGLSPYAGAAATQGDQTYYMVHNPQEAINYATGELFIAGQRGTALDVVCVNLNTLQSCGSLFLGNYSDLGGGNHAPLEQVGDKYYVLASNGNVHCVNIKTKSTCGTTLYNISGSSSNALGVWTVTSNFGTKVNDVKKVFFAISQRVFCHDTVTNASCAGWSNYGNSSPYGGVMPIVNAAGVPQGVCDGYGSYCYRINGPSFQISAAAQNFFMYYSFAPRTTWGGGSSGVKNAYHYSWNAGALQGTRIVTGRSDGYGVSCFDFATNAVCPNYPLRPDYLTRGYTTNMDPTRPNCVLHIGDAAKAMLFDLFSGGACTDGGDSEKPKTINVDPSQYYRCDATQATVTSWDAVRLSPTIPWNVSGGLKEVKVTLQDANGVQLPPLYNPVRYFAPGQYSLSIADVPYASYSKLRVIVQMTGQGGLSSTSEVGIDVTWKGDPIQLCFQTKQPANPGCPTTVDTKVTLAKFENPDNVFDETITGSKSLYPGVPNTGYAAVSAATSPRSILTDDVAGREGRTRILQGRYDMQYFTGDLLSYELDSSGQIDASTKKSAATQVVPSLSRNVFSAKPGSGQPGSMVPYKLSLASASTAQQAALNKNVAGITDNRGNDRVAYHYGVDGPFRARNANSNAKLGPVIGSGPVVLNTNVLPVRPESQFKDYTKYRTGMVTKGAAPLALWGGNDGALHAFTFDSNGNAKEAWSFVPDVMLQQTNRLTDSSLAEQLRRPYYVDAIPMIGHVDLNGTSTDGWAAVVVNTYGDGARAITALDISNTDLSTGKGVLFEYTNATTGLAARGEGVNDLADLGILRSQPAYDESVGSHQIVRVKDGTDIRWAVLVGNGVKSDESDDGSPSGTGRPVLYAFYLDAPPTATSPRWRRIDIQTSAGITNEPGLTLKNGLSHPRPVDTDGDGVADVVYAGDLQGNLWRVDVSNIASPKTTRLFETIGKQPIYSVPVAVRNTIAGACTTANAKKCWQVTFGSGIYFSPIFVDMPKTVPTQHLYGVLDKGDSTTVSQGSLLENVATTERSSTGIDFKAVTPKKIDYAAGKRGWYIALGANEHAIGATKMLPSGLVSYPVVRPGKGSGSTAVCQAASSWLFELHPITGAPAGLTFDFNGDGKIDTADVLQSGKAPAAMAISGNQFAAPVVLLDSANASNSMSLVFPSLGQDTGAAPNTFGSGSTPPTGQGGNAKNGNAKQLGRLTWREVFPK
ncbi:MAG: hypothetical protein C4K60_08880 [Ideonella sp. MAG2]|nr:MAG: hypothetical protein C4K60_08880 [Ideonella sp. MAG2]